LPYPKPPSDKVPVVRQRFPFPIMGRAVTPLRQKPFPVIVRSGAAKQSHALSNGSGVALSAFGLLQ
jgi:hypothetical protein